MKRTQIQLPDELYERTRRLAEAKEVSLAELVRRGLEYTLSIHPLDRPPCRPWKLAPPSNVGLRRDPLKDPDWRVAVNMASGSPSNPSAHILNEAEPKSP
jgi:hypothetical protein